jgi:hypothetical protein
MARLLTNNALGGHVGPTWAKTSGGTLSDSIRWIDRMFFFFSNRLGCFGSLLLSAVATIALLFFLGVVRF